MIQDYNLVLEHLLDILFCIQVEPIFQPQPAELMIHLLLLKEIDLLCLLAIALFIQSHELQEQVLSNLVHWLCHENLASKLRMHR